MGGWGGSLAGEGRSGDFGGEVEEALGVFLKKREADLFTVGRCGGGSADVRLKRGEAVGKASDSGEKQWEK